MNSAAKSAQQLGNRLHRLWPPATLGPDRQNNPIDPPRTREILDDVRGLPVQHYALHIGQTVANLSQSGLDLRPRFILISLGPIAPCIPWNLLH